MMSHFDRSVPPDIRDTYSLLVLNITFRIYYTRKRDEKIIQLLDQNESSFTGISKRSNFQLAPLHETGFCKVVIIS
ncbi:hypothetical protein CASFOL_033397 [Castilleja foliolosa]|uniref:Uncharacterized protein n=1 Tax=Castilleja foliolosa TaxID=1961234 RepID=A0ABD3BZZ8_9LAMI